MYKQKFKYKVNRFLNYRAGFSLFESASENKFYNIAFQNGIKLKRQYRFTKNLSLIKRLFIYMFPFLHKGYRCDFKYKNIIIEIDSVFHNKKYDLKRDILMKKYGFRIIRIDCKLLYSPKKSKEYKIVLNTIQYLKKQ